MIEINYYIIRRLLLFAETLGFTPEEICASVNLDYTEIIDQKIILNDEQLEQVWKATIKVTGEPDIGYHLGLHINIEAIGLLGMIIQSANTVEQAIKMAVDYIPIATNMIKIKFDIKGDCFKVAILPADNLLLMTYPNRVQQVCLMTLAFMMRMHGLLTLKKIRRVEVGLPAHVKNRNIAKGYVSKPAVLTDIEYYSRSTTDYLKEKVLSADFEALQSLRKRALTLLNSKRKPYTRRVESIIVNQFDGRFMTLSEVSGQMNIGTRTLQRQLKEEGTNFNSLLNDIKKVIAVNHLKETRSISQTAIGLGFTDTSSFGKAFKKWTGSSPAQFISKDN